MRSPDGGTHSLSKRVAMEANVTELWQIVESMQLELDSMSMDMDALWLMLGAILVVCEVLHSLITKKSETS